MGTSTLTTGSWLSWVFAGEWDRVPRARASVREVLPAGCARAEDVELVVVELCTNAVRHSFSGAGGAFRLALSRTAAYVEVEVHDQGVDIAPYLPTTDVVELDAGDVVDIPEVDRLRGFGRGLCIVDALADRWGHAGDCRGRTVWAQFEAAELGGDVTTDPACRARGGDGAAQPPETVLRFLADPN